MKKLLALSMLIPLAMVCSCQKQDAAAEQQLAQRKAELDTREKALDEREKGIGREGKNNRACGHDSSRRSIASSEKGRLFGWSAFSNNPSRFSAARQLTIEG
jgi:hypothetical protein